jgi:hypothetical protein
MKKNILYFSSVMLTLWLGASLAVDIIAIPSVFRTLNDVAQAGKVGMVVFSRFNKLEVIVSLLATIFFVIGVKNFWPLAKWKFHFLLTSHFILIGISVMFCFFWTPAIIQYSQQMFELSTTDPLHAQALLQHRFYHKAYVRVEGIKIIIILVSLVMQYFALQLRPKLKDS